MPSVLFVCTGNQFRSPIAAAHFRQLLVSAGREDNWWVGSAGTWAIEGTPSPAEAIAAAARLGANLQEHRSRTVSRPLLTDSDLIVVMTSGQREGICLEFPETCSRVRLLAELSGGLPGDVPDPPSAPLQIFEIMQDVCQLVERGFPTIIRLSEELSEHRS